MYRSGKKLLADFTDMPTSIYEMVRAGLYKFVSVELLRNVQAGTRELPWVLDAVALLGADQPAVGTLRDLQSLTMSRKPVLQARARVAFTRGKFFSTGATKAMDENQINDVVAKAVATALADYAQKAEAKFTAQIEKVKADAKAENEAALKKQAAEAHRAQIKQKFEAAIKAEIIIPAERESYYRFNRVDDDAVVTTIKLDEVDAYIEKFGDKEKIAASKRTTTTTTQGDPAEATMSAAERVVHRAKKLCYSRQQDPNKFEHYTAAVQEVLKADKALGESYKRLEAAPAAA